MSRRHLLLIAITLAAVACSPKETPAPPEKAVTITTAPVVRRDLPIVETAVGAETAVVTALGYDPTRAGTTSFIRLPFPEATAQRIKIGQTVTLANFGEEKTVQGRIREIRPALNATTASREVIVAVPPTRGWRPRGSVRGEVTLGVRRGALTVPEQAVVLRPAGRVIYAIENSVAHERPVQTGLVREGYIELTQGAASDEIVAVDGAGLLSEGAKVKVAEAGSKEGPR